MLLLQEWTVFADWREFKWASKLLGYDFEIRFWPGRKNQVADAWSLRVYFMVVILFQIDECETCETEVQQDEKLTSLRCDLLVNGSTHKGNE